MNSSKPVCEINSTGDKYWWLNGERHRDDGPAIEWTNGDKQWWINGKRHRTDGPAIEWADGNNFWYLNGRHYSLNEYVKKAKWSDEQIVMYKLEFG